MVITLHELGVNVCGLTVLLHYLYCLHATVNSGLSGVKLVATS